MLVLSRKVGEKLIIDGEIIIEVVRIHGNRVTVGIKAPAEVKVLRGELREHQTKPDTEERVLIDGMLVAC